MSKLTLKPSMPGLIVRDPDDGMQPIPSGGKVVEDSTYWQRRLQEGDVVLTDHVDPPPAPSADDES